MHIFVRILVLPHVRLVTKDNKTSWYLDILVDEDGDQVSKTVTFDKNPRRDALLNELRNDLAQGNGPDGVRDGVFHGLYIKGNRMTNGGTFYEMRYDPQVHCQCNGHIEADSDEETPL